MKISVVTISFNQANYLSACLDSVAAQEGPWEHIIVDPGSTDGSRDLIAQRRNQFSEIILDKDNGPADGLNRGFAKATGRIFYYLNSDDVVFPGAFNEAREYLTRCPNVDVVVGHGNVLDTDGSTGRPLYSDPVSRFGLAHAGSILIQPATFIRAHAFQRVGGFNNANRSNWDGELIVDLFLSGARFKIVNHHWGGYRIHEKSITGTGNLDLRVAEWGRERYERLMGGKPRWYTYYIRQLYRARRLIRHPSLLNARLYGGRVYGSMRK
ncbi:glycosyltransferase [Mesorhizobium sp.]|uniref:glycosyltransferase n=1 Tax=Mesorhizobium sp. TaxID=1871066 RepID=UPI000FEA050C|nr:glycosyltransferase [Mesorhizobium sp.]RWN60797.1 MAG: glycosyltransferase [Mesorhizobium sp.]RWO31126.1 MAG: glycosyltransferase [Mesorhizobium sp.]